MGSRKYQINIRLSEEEYRDLTRSATLCGIGRASYVRMLLLEKRRAEERGEVPSSSAK